MWLVNSLYEPTGAYDVVATLRNMSGADVYTQTAAGVAAPADGVVFALQLPDPTTLWLSQVYFLTLRIRDAAGHESRNDYWCVASLLCQSVRIRISR